MGFGDQVDAFGRKTLKEFDKSYRKLVLGIWRDAVTGTPVDTGVLKGNWQVGIGQKNGNQLGAGSPAADVGDLTIEDTAFVFNNMEYASAIENGIAGTARVPRKMLFNAVQAAKLRSGR